MKALQAVSTLTLAATLCVPELLSAWAPEGVRVSPLSGNQVGANVEPDGVGGWYVSWTDFEQEDIHVQRLTADGAVAPGWPEGGLPVCTAPGDQAFYSMVPDGSGGVIFIWSDNRAATVTEYDIYVQRVLPTGQIAPGWPSNGLAICTALGFQRIQLVTVDGEGGIIAAWNDNRNVSTQSSDVYAARVLLDGTLDPAWPENGRLVAGGSAQQTITGLVPDGSGGAIVVWIGGPLGFSSYALRLNSDGTAAAGWQPGGNLIAVPGRAVAVIPDGTSGLFAAMLDGRTAPSGEPDGFYVDVYVQHVLGSGTLPEGWTLEGKPVAVADNWQHPVVIRANSVGGAYLAWRDARDYATSTTDIYIQSLTANGEPAPGWPVNGLSAASQPSFQEDPSLVMSPVDGRAVVGYESLLDSRVYVQQIAAAGTYMDPTEPFGHPAAIGATRGQEQMRLGVDQLGNVVATWTDLKSSNNRDIYAQRVVTSVPTATAVALVRATATPSSILLEWYAAGEAPNLTRVYRSAGGAPWQPIGTPRVASTGRITYEDGLVSAGERYAYRLGYLTEQGEIFTPEAWVEVPAAHRFALAGARPNPVIDDVNVHFSLRTTDPADLELFDLAGRVIASTSLSSPSPGNQQLKLLDGRRLEVGVYWLRLRQGTGVAKSRVVVIR